MKHKVVLLIAFILFFSSFVINQERKVLKVSEKTGLYVENEGLNEVYYKNGVKNGVFKAYHKKNRKLRVFGLFKNNIKSGNWYYFNEKSILIMKETEIQLNKMAIRQEGGILTTPRYSSRAVFYHPNGSKSEEGILLYNDVEIDYTQIKKWLYYDKTGNVIDSIYFDVNAPNRELLQ